MRIDGYTLVLQLVNFAVLVWLLQRFLYRPILRRVDARRAQIEQELGRAERTQAQAQEHLAAVDSQRASIAAERTKALAACAAEVDEVRAARRASAEREAAALLEEARKTLAAERQKALEEAERCALDLATDLACRLFSELPESLRTQAWLDRIEEYLAALPDAERAALARPLSPAAPVTIVTASALSSAETENWREKLSRAFGSRAIAFGVDPALGAGAELHLPNAILTFSLRSAVAALRSERARHAPPQPAQA